ncbi:hypothetical protein OPV22_005555 [Ensete ventricosum]|uniref:Uncharacterized protein n=1 Tax=Ensete ventricosum TaxID=4639 RepID=A0AAV8RLA7_ENSVE|nr:hypothetical protein OPV22_005555 [Ensete ventricosum]
MFSANISMKVNEERPTGASSCTKLCSLHGCHLETSEMTKTRLWLFFLCHNFGATRTRSDLWIIQHHSCTPFSYQLTFNLDSSILSGCAFFILHFSWKTALSNIRFPGCS